MKELMHCEHAKQSLVLIHMLQLTTTDKHLSLEQGCEPYFHILSLKYDGANY